MKVVRSLDALQPPPGGSVVTIGNFDGVHLGHREIFRRVVGKASTLGAAAVVLTFEPHPLRLLAPERAPLRINTPEEKVRLIEASCVDLLLVLPFDRALARLPARAFVEQILIERLALRSLVVGYDYAFGRNREGDLDFLRGMAQKHDFVLEVLPPIARGEVVYSSSRIRSLLQAGQVNDVVNVLGRHFTLDGIVVAGAARGRQLGFPTANLRTSKELLPKDGVYAVKVRWRDAVYDGVVNIGRRPTFPGAAPSLEIHLLDFAGDLYGETLRIYFVERLRDELRFATVGDLQAKVSEDIAAARRLLTERTVIEYRDSLDCGLQT
ncbi:MAG: bifunctional riboflavin kinase/FAD synthetase [Desulfuromonadales bacterium]|nr:bifunctional riboflavin kinase/FAD synthetase [Desulfuromonadales bacterium]